ncbi:hypothetical protein BKP45_06815 [Anaerobacillus alkalidiazotrophicus]|uniref:NapC/NirT cytochrome c N-terminal domain-containing protein n=1 Tax=Anaerobacillus alkalidiazotrophicus TaxID=472963 RepID=A0A1S2MCP8_9BACI|nr:NapC/NirT family cytochrome c [Anaerobacillus alkalidiazotrophicus]OIJ22344.1 hypothetical protein BKP45_06815 [Anaerobacillus alkalidiazotrophicus]
MKNDHDQEEKQLQELGAESSDAYRKKLKIIKVATFFFIGLVGLALSVTIGVQATSTNTFCASCHMMQPQVLTWEASSHSSVNCKDCHIKPGLEGTVEAKIGGLWELYHTITDTYVAPIRMPSLIPDESCTKCHNMENRKVTSSGDIISEHGIHADKEVKCVTCHAGVAHGKVSERRVTFKSDFEHWDETLGAYMMSYSKYTAPQKATCMDCHELKRAPLTCEACHSTGMFPIDHEDKDFLTKNHGKLSEEELLTCHSCHSFQSKNPIKELKDKTYYTKFILSEPDHQQIPVQEYAKTNTFCADCHSQSPDSHQAKGFFSKHGTFVNENKDGCLTCHDYDKSSQSQSPVTNVTCATCHSGGHPDQWQQKHPTPLSPEPKFDRTCLSCHVEQTCTSCHIDGRKEEN